MILTIWSPLNFLSSSIQNYGRDIAGKAAVVYVSLRAVNAVLSTAQEVEIGGSFVVGATIQPLKALEPIDDTIERIAGAVFVVMIASSIIAISAAPVGMLGFGLLSIGLGISLLPKRFGMNGLIRPAMSFGLMFAIILPLGFFLSNFLAENATQRAWDENSLIVAEITGAISETAALEKEPKEGSTLSRMFSEAKDGVDAVGHYTQLAGEITKNADRLFKSYLELLALLFLEVLVLPFVFLLSFLAAWRSYQSGRIH